MRASRRIPCPATTSPEPLRLFGVWALAASLVFLSLSCSSNPVASGAGGGIETTNGFAATFRNPDGTPASYARIRIRPADYLADQNVVSNEYRIDTETDSVGFVTIPELSPRRYTIEVLGDSGLGVVFHEAVDESRDSIHSHGIITLRPTGRIEGSIHRDNIDPSVRITAGLYGLQRVVAIDVDGQYTFKNLPPQTYQVFIGSDQDTVGNTDIPFVTVEENRSTTIQQVNLPIDYRIDSITVRNFLVDQGLETAEWSEMVGPPINNRIKRLYLNDRGIRHLAPSIGELDVLWTLDLSGNPLQMLPPEINSLYLPELYLNRIPMDTIIPGFEHLRRVAGLSLDSTGIRVLPDLSEYGVGKLSLKGNGYAAIPDQVFQTTNLSRLDMAGNNLTSLRGIGNLPNLQYIQFSENNIDSLPDEIGNCTKLREIRMTDNNLAYISSRIGECRLMESMWLYANDLPSLPDEFTTLQNLKTLRLESNALTTLPEDMGRLGNLEVFYLSNNPLTDLPTSLLSLTEVSIRVRNCRLCTPTPDIAQWLDTHARGENWRSLQIGCE